MVRSTRRVTAAIAVCCVATVLPSCGFILGSQGASKKAQHDLAPPEVFDDAPNALNGAGGSGDEADREAKEERARKKAAEKKAQDAAERRNGSGPPTSVYNSFVPAPPGVVRPGALAVNDPSVDRSRVNPSVKPTDTPGSAPVELWPAAFDPGTPSEPRTPYCNAVLRMMTAGDSLWRRYAVASGTGRRLLVGEMIAAARALAQVTSVEFAAILNQLADQSTATLGGANAENARLVGDVLLSGGAQVGQYLQTVIPDAYRRCEVLNTPSDVGLPGFGTPSEEAVRTKLGT